MIIYDKLKDESTIGAKSLESGMFRTLEEINLLATKLSRHYPKQAETEIGIYEMLLNAIEHGNLGIGYEEKTALCYSGKWYDEVYRRMELPENKNKYAYYEIKENQNAIELKIRDKGKGFNWRKFININDSSVLPNGRGIAIARLISFDEITYSWKGNEAICRVNLS